LKHHINIILSLILSVALVLAFIPATANIAVAVSVDSSTTLADGCYSPDSFTYSGGTGKVSILCPKITAESGKATATIVFKSRYYTKLKLDGTTYDAKIDSSAGTSTFAIPVDLNSSMSVTGTTTAMSAIHDIDYTIKATIAEPEMDKSTPVFDNSAAVPDASYKPDSFTYSGGTGKVKLSCPQITVNGGKAFATLVFSSKYFTKLKTDGRIYKSSINTSGNTSAFVVPIYANSKYDILGTTTAMSTSHDITYSIKACLSKRSKVITPGADPSSGGGQSDNTAKAKKLKDGTYKIRTEVRGKMFYIYPKASSKHYSIITVKKGKITAVITLDGQGYDYVYMGTKSQAEKAKKSTWSKYASRNGFYSYKIHVSKLDKKLNIAGHSHKYNNWYGDRTIIFYSGTAKKVKVGTTATGNKKNKVTKRTNKKSTAVSSKKTTASVNNSTSLKNGIYAPDQFSWSGGSGRLAYIKCTKIKVAAGRAYATIVFGSSAYDTLKASGHLYSKTGAGLSKFVIPVRLNANNTIIGRTSAMSQPHWIEYRIYPYIAKASGSSKKSSLKASTGKMSKSAPEIVGLKTKSAVKVESAEYFKIFNYEKGVKLLEFNISKGTGLSTKSATSTTSTDEIEYDDEGNAIAKSQHEFTEEIYQNKVVNYLLVPDKVQLPAGLDKNYIIIRIPAKKTYVASSEALGFIKSLSCTENVSLSGIKTSPIKFAGSYSDPTYSMFVKEQTGLAILPSTALPEKIEKPHNFFQWFIFLFTRGSQEKAQAKQNKQLKSVEKNYTALNIPVLIDRSKDESSALGKAEWVKVYGALYGCEKSAEKIYEKSVKNEEKK